MSAQHGANGALAADSAAEDGKAQGAARLAMAAYTIRILGILSLLMLSFLAGNRSVMADPDTAQYVEIFLHAALNDQSYQGEREVEIGFTYLAKILGFFTAIPGVFLGVVYFLTSFFLFKSISAIKPSVDEKIFFVVTWLCFPFYYNQLFNVIRSALALSLVYYVFFSVGKLNFRAVCLILISLTIHSSAMLMLPAFVISRFIKLRLIWIVWLLAVLVSYLNLIGEGIAENPLINILLSEYQRSYLTGDNDEYVVGFKYTFFLFSLLPIIYFFYRKHLRTRYRISDCREAFFEKTFRAYLLLNAVGFIFSFMPYYDRFMIWSWSLFPAFLLDYYFGFSSYKKTVVLFLTSIIGVSSFFYMSLLR